MSRIAPPVNSRPRAFAALAAMGALAAAAWLGSPAVASAAQPDASMPTATVYYSLRDLSTEPRIRALYQRIVATARTVCPEYDSRDLEGFNQSLECQRAAVARAVHQIGSPRLAAVHARARAQHG